MASEMTAAMPSAMTAVTTSAKAVAMPLATVAAMALGDCNRQRSRAADGSYSVNSNNSSKTAQPWQSDGINNDINNGISIIAAGNGGRQLGEAKAKGDKKSRDDNRKKTQTGLSEQDSLSSGMAGDESGGQSR